MDIRQALAPIRPNGARSGIKRTSNGGVTIHNTGNYSQGAGASNHGTYLQNGGANTQTSWHIAVDDHEAVQSIPSNEVAWHAGDGRGNGNMTTVGVEICVNPDSDLVQATDNGAIVAAQELKKQGLGIDHLYQHHDWSGKNCPAEIRAGNPYNWDTFKAKVAVLLGEDTLTPQPTPEAPTGLAWGVGTKVCVEQLSRSADGTAGVVSTHYEGTITKVYPGQPYPYLLDGGAGFVNDAIIANDPHIPGADSTPQTPTSSTKYGVGQGVCTCILASSSTGGNVYKGDWRGTITSVVDGAPYPYLLDDGNIGWTNDEGIDSDPHVS